MKFVIACSETIAVVITEHQVSSIPMQVYIAVCLHNTYYVLIRNTNLFLEIIMTFVFKLVVNLYIIAISTNSYTCK